jgi:hypothetical protein
MTAVTATTVTSEQPKGDDPSVPPVQVSRNGGRAYWQAASGGVGTAATAVLGYLTGHLDAAAIIAIVVGAIVISLIFRGAITDAIRMQTAADPDKKNVT